MKNTKTKIRNLFVGSFLIMLLLNSVAATSCPSDFEFRTGIRNAALDYLTDPSTSQFTRNEINDLIDFYLSEDLGTADCSTPGTRSGIPICDILAKAGVNCPSDTTTTTTIDCIWSHGCCETNDDCPSSSPYCVTSAAYEGPSLGIGVCNPGQPGHYCDKL